jgi:hypothetical protein
VATELGNTVENYVAMKRNMTSGPRQAIMHPSIQAQLAAWPTPTSSNGNGSGVHGEGSPNLQTEVRMCAWPTPLANAAAGGGSEAHLDGRRSNLRDSVFLTSWPTPAARDWKSSASNKHNDNARPLNEVARLGMWDSGHGASNPTESAQLEDSGPAPNGCSAETPPEARRSPGQLNPEHSRWLMGYPTAWGKSRDTATPSSRK